MDIEDFVNGFFEKVESFGRFLEKKGDSIFGTTSDDDDDEDYDEDDEDFDDDEEDDEDGDDEDDEYDRREAERKRIMAEKKRDLTSDINTNLRSFSAKTHIKPEKKVTASQCKFRSFEADMRPMTDSIGAGILTKFQERAKSISCAEKELEQLDKVILAIKQNDIQP